MPTTKIPRVKLEHLEHALSKAGIDFNPERLRKPFYVAAIAQSLARSLRIDARSAVSVIQRAVGFLVFVNANRAELEKREFLRGPLTGFDVTPSLVLAAARVPLDEAGLQLADVLAYLDKIETS